MAQPHGALSLMFLGAEGSGKTTLVQQLRCIAREGAILESVEVSPSTGQETEVLPLAAPLSAAEVELAHATTKKAEAARVSEVAGTSRPPPVVQVREVGGRMVAVWPKFLEKVFSGPTADAVAVCFVVDASAPHSLSLAAVELMNFVTKPLTKAGDAPTLLEARQHAAPLAIIINKIRMPSALSSQLVMELLQVDDIRRIRCEGGGPVAVFCVDSWAADGLLDLWHWIVSLAVT